MSSRLLVILYQKLTNFYQIAPVFPMKYAVFRGGLTRACPLGIDLPPQQPLPLVQSSFANVHLMNAIFWVKYLLKSVWSFVHNILMAFSQG